MYSKTFDTASAAQLEVNSENLTKGVYIITLVQNNNSIGQSKLVVE